MNIIQCVPNGTEFEGKEDHIEHVVDCETHFFINYKQIYRSQSNNTNIFYFQKKKKSCMVFFIGFEGFHSKTVTEEMF